MEGEFGNEMRFKETAISNRNFRNEKCNELNRKHSGKNDQQVQINKRKNIRNGGQGQGYYI